MKIAIQEAHARRLLIALLIMALLSTWNVGTYLYKFHYNEIIQVMVMVTFLYMASTMPLERPHFTRYVIGLPVAILLLCVLSATRFSLYNTTTLLPSILAQRQLVLLLTLPITLIAIRHGLLNRADIGRIFVLAAVTLIIIYFGLYYGIDFQAIDSSNNPKRLLLMTNDSWRGYRLRIWIFPVFLLALYSVLQLYPQRHNPVKIIIPILIIVASCYAIATHIPRQLLAAFAVGLPIIMIAARSRKVFFSALYAVLLMGIAGLLYIWADYEHIEALLKNDNSYTARLESYLIAFKQVGESMLLGAGSASYATLSDQTLYGNRFYASDIGVAGIAFIYGLPIAGIYMLITVYVFYELLRQYWRTPSHLDRDFHFTLMVAGFVSVLLLPIQAVYAYAGTVLLALMVSYIETQQYDERGIETG